MPHANALGPSAGFWRRFFAFIIDFILAMLPFLLLTALLYPLTGGRIQINSIAVYKTCRTRNPTQSVADLVPTPPAASNFERDCRSFFFGKEVGHVVTIGRVTKQGSTIQIVSRSYALGTDGRQVEAFPMELLALACFFLYRVLAEWRFGRSVGDRLMRIQVFYIDDITRAGIPLRRAAARHVLQWLPFLAFFGVLLFLGITGRGDPEAIVRASSLIPLAVAGLIAIVWSVWTLVQICRKVDRITTDGRGLPSFRADRATRSPDPL